MTEKKVPLPAEIATAITTQRESMVATRDDLQAVVIQLKEEFKERQHENPKDSTLPIAEQMISKLERRVEITQRKIAIVDEMHRLLIARTQGYVVEGAPQNELHAEMVRLDKEGNDLYDEVERMKLLIAAAHQETGNEPKQ